MNQHQRFRERLAYRSELSPKQERQLEEHLSGCVECRAIAADYARQAQLLRALPELTPPRALRLGTLHQVHQLPSTSRWSLRWPAWGALTVAVGMLVVLVAAGLLNRPHGNSRSATRHRATIISSSPVANNPVSPSRTPVGKPAVSARPGTHRPLQSAAGQKTSPPPVPSPGQLQAPVPASGQPYTIPTLNGSAPVLGQALPATATLRPVVNTPVPSRRPLLSPSPPPSPSVHRRRPVSRIPVLTSAPPSPTPPTPVPLFSVQPGGPTPSATSLASPVPQQTASPPVVRRTIAAILRPTAAVPIGAAAQATATPTTSPIQVPAVSAIPSPTKTLPSASIIAPIPSPSPATTSTP